MIILKIHLKSLDVHWDTVMIHSQPHICRAMKNWKDDVAGHDIMCHLQIQNLITAGGDQTRTLRQVTGSSKDLWGGDADLWGLPSWRKFPGDLGKDWRLCQVILDRWFLRSSFWRGKKGSALFNMSPLHHRQIYSDLKWATIGYPWISHCTLQYSNDSHP